MSSVTGSMSGLTVETVFRDWIRQMFPLALTYIALKVKESLNRPVVAQRVPGGLGSQSSMTFVI